MQNAYILAISVLFSPVCLSSPAEWSARFANRVNSRTVGLTTGVSLTAMGALLIALHSWEYIAKILPSS